MKLRHDATIEFLEKRDAESLRNYWYGMWYHPGRFAKGPGSRTYVKELACFASNLSTYMMCGEEMYKDIANRCAEKARAILAKYGAE